MAQRNDELVTHAQTVYLLVAAVITQGMNVQLPRAFAFKLLFGLRRNSWSLGSHSGRTGSLASCNLKQRDENNATYDRGKGNDHGKRPWSDNLERLTDDQRHYHFSRS